jgi:hypothetical protein
MPTNIQPLPSPGKDGIGSRRVRRGPATQAYRSGHPRAALCAGCRSHHSGTLGFVNSARCYDPRKSRDPIVDPQIEYSLISRGIEAEILPTCREFGIASPLRGIGRPGPKPLGRGSGKHGAPSRQARRRAIATMPSRWPCSTASAVRRANGPLIPGVSVAADAPRIHF